MTIESPAFDPGERIPEMYTCDGDRTLSPPLAFAELPEDTVSLALIVDDPDVPKELLPEGHFTHWVLFNIPPETLVIPEGGSAGIAGSNTGGGKAYTGPCPPPEYEPSTHRYIFSLYALDASLDLPEGATKQKVEAAMQDHILATAKLIGTYSRI
jgi:Raf kinase inhibitor-like YbhB/YbcL family protein